MKPASFDYLRPETLDEALSALERCGADARIIAGGQSLGAMLNMRLVKPKVIIDINRLGELSMISESDGAIVTGATVRQADALAAQQIRDRVPLLAYALPHVGHYQTRNRGTLGGSVAHADPSAEIPLALATLGGEVQLRSRRKTRWLPATKFFQSALVTTREPEEMVSTLRWPGAAAGYRYAFREFAVRGGDFAIVAVACVIFPGRDGTIRLGFGGCGQTPQIVNLPYSAAERDELTLKSLARDAASKIECHSDMLASADYRRNLAAVLAGDALHAACGGDAAHA